MVWLPLMAAKNARQNLLRKAKVIFRIFNFIKPDEKPDEYT